MGVGERLASGVRSGRDWAVEVVEWRNPSASGPYLMGANGLFWLCAFYLSQERQEQVLLSIASALLIAELFSLALAATPVQSSKATASQVASWSGRAPGPRARSGALYLATLGPLRTLLGPPLGHIWRLLFFRLPEVALFTLCCGSYSCLLEAEREKAAWAAYASLLVALGAPAWRCHAVSERTWARASKAGRWVRRGVLGPVWRIAVALARITFYIVTFQWVPPLLRKIKNVILGAIHWIQDKVPYPLFSHTFDASKY